MSLINKFFGSGKEAVPGSASTQFTESEPDEDTPVSRNARKRELVQMVLRDTMRKHGIPSDWVDCRTLSSVSRSGRHGLHANFVVKQAHDRMHAYVFAFQDSFERELTRIEPRARDWLLSIGWEFVGFNMADMPEPKAWAPSAPGSLQAPLLDSDWAPQESGFGPQTLPQDEEPPKTEDDIQRDLKALFAIRDAAIADTAPKRPRRPESGDFQATQPSGDGVKK
jgi:hypothetical protein